MSTTTTLLAFLNALPAASSLSATDYVLVFGSDGLKKYRGLDKAICKKTISDGVDFDTLTDDGAYFISGNNHNGKPVTNISRAQLLVLNQSATATNRIQLLIHANATEMYLRQCWDGVWKPWVKIAKDTSYVAPTSAGGGGNTLFINSLRNLTERRVA